MKKITQYKHFFKDKFTNEIFFVESSFAISFQALIRNPKYLLNRLEGRRDEDYEFLDVVIEDFLLQNAPEDE